MPPRLELIPNRYDPDDVQRFLEHLRYRPVLGCWEWSGTRTKAGYGLFHRRRGSRSAMRARRASAREHGYEVPLPSPQGAHRVAYAIWRGPVGDKLVCHHCDNPPCCRPDHLFLGTDAENVADMVAKGRTSVLGKLSTQAVRQIRTIYEAGEANQRQLAQMFGVSQPLICNIVNGKVWAHVEALGPPGGVEQGAVPECVKEGF